MPPENDTIAVLARSITWAGSKQTYYIAHLLVDNDLVDDFYRAYAYFRWADDIIDVSSQSEDERVLFVRRQRELIDRLYRKEQLNDLAPEEEILAELIRHDRGENSGLQSFIRNMFSVVEFDAYRKDKLVSQEEMALYTMWLGKSVTDGLQYFIGNGHPYSATDDRYLAARAAHFAHLLRDTLQDTADGFINIPREYLETHAINPEDVDSPPYRAWVRERVEQARKDFRAGKRYLAKLDVLRCKIAGYWYCVRFEGVLDAIERDEYVLRAAYKERRRATSLLKMVWLGISMTLRHIFTRGLFARKKYAGKSRQDM